jgi:hypothetical protein
MTIWWNDLPGAAVPDGARWSGLIQWGGQPKSIGPSTGPKADHVWKCPAPICKQMSNQGGYLTMCKVLRFALYSIDGKFI